MKKLIVALMIVGNLFFFSNVNAEVITYTATAEDTANKLESQEVAQLRALDKAIKIATAQAAADLKKFELSDEEISAIIAGSYELGEIKYNQADLTWQAVVEIKIDDAQVKNWNLRGDREQFTLVNQSREAQKLAEANDKRVENLRERAKTMTRQDKKFFKDEFAYTSNEFLSNRKVAEGNKFFYRGRINDAINLYTEAIALNKYNETAYNRRGNLYNVIAEGQKNIPMADSNRQRAIKDLEMAIRLNNNYAEAFTNRGLAYYDSKNYSLATKDFDRAIKLEPNVAQNYIYRAQCTRHKDGNVALADFSKAIELSPKAAYVYTARGNFYEQDLKDFSKALEDYTRAIEFGRQSDVSALNYNNRGGVYQKMKIYGNAIDDYTRAIEIMESSEQTNPLLAWIYRKRGECYQFLGDNSRAQADLKKFGELQRR